MPVNYPLLYMLLGTAAVAGGTVAVYKATQPPSRPADVRAASPTTPEVPAVVRPMPKLEPEKAPAARPTPPPPAVSQPTPPSFDVVRIERTGDGVIAGRAEPRWRVVVESKGHEIARVLADANGEWAVVLAKPLAPGEHSLELRAYAPEGTRGLVSEQTVAVSVAGSKSRESTVVALTEPGKPTRVLTPERDTPPPPKAPVTGRPPEKPAAPAAKPVEPETPVTFSAVDYEGGQAGAGTLFVSGEAKPGARVSLYLDNDLVGETITGPGGRWTLTAARKLGAGNRHTLRADAVRADGKVVSRAEVPFTPPAPKVVAAKAPEAPAAEAPTERPPATTTPEEPAGVPPAAAQPEEPPVVAARTDRRAPEKPDEAAPPAAKVTEAIETAKPTPAVKPRKKVRERRKRGRVVVVREGDTLWHIAERRYGRGERYTAIFRRNRGQIRDPDLIYPGQRVRLPAR